MVLSEILATGSMRPFQELAHYPGMRPRDVAIWERFIIDNPGAFDRVWYNVHLGNPVRYDEHEDEMRRNGMYEVSQWCVDVIAQKRDKLYTIEVKPDAKAGAIGQAIAYTKLITAEIPDQIDLQPVVITDDASPITENAARLLGVELVQVADHTIY